MDNNFEVEQLIIKIHTTGYFSKLKRETVKVKKNRIKFILLRFHRHD